MARPGDTNEAAERNFVVQQGFVEPEPGGCVRLYGALMFQPRIVMGLVVVGIVSQWALWWAGLGALLWWSAALHRWNPFDALYNRTLGSRPGEARLTPAPAPRRFAQALAGSFSVGIAASLAAGLTGLAWGLEAFFLVAVAALAVGKLCFGSFLFHLLRGRAAFAVATLPWARGR
jgi:hypothetical protein